MSQSKGSVHHEYLPPGQTVNRSADQPINPHVIRDVLETLIEKDRLKKRCTTDQLKVVPDDLFQTCFAAWNLFLEKCISANGDYFEGDNL